MRCYKCGNEYDDSQSFCPECGAAAAVPVILDTSVKIPKAKHTPIIPKAKPESKPVQAAPVLQDTGEQPQTAAKDKSKLIIGVLAGLLIVMTASTVLLLIDKFGAKDKDEDSSTSTYRTNVISIPETPNDSKGSVQESNTAAELVFTAASMYANDRMEMGDVVPYGIICSSTDVGPTSSYIAEDGYTVPNLTNTINEYLGDDFKGYEWFVAFNGGLPTAAYAAPTARSKYIGSYPSTATKETQLTFKDGRDVVNFSFVDETKSANDLYGASSASASEFSKTSGGFFNA